jgi:hypothetical protein
VWLLHGHVKDEPLQELQRHAAASAPALRRLTHDIKFHKSLPAGVSEKILLEFLHSEQFAVQLADKVSKTEGALPLTTEQRREWAPFITLDWLDLHAYEPLRDSHFDRSMTI